MEIENVNNKANAGLATGIIGTSLAGLLTLGGLTAVHSNAMNNGSNGNSYVTKDDEIDVPKLYKYFSEQAQKTAVTFQMPLIGAVTFKKTDIEKIYQLIMES